MATMPFSGAANGWTISGITSWQAGGSLEQETGSGQLRFRVEPHLCQPSSQRQQRRESPAESAHNTYYGTDAPLNIMPVLSCNPKSGLKSNQLLNQTCFCCSGDWPVWRAKDSHSGPMPHTSKMTWRSTRHSRSKARKTFNSGRRHSTG